jgi:hypothetical protein
MTPWIPRPIVLCLPIITVGGNERPPQPPRHSLFTNETCLGRPYHIQGSHLRRIVGGRTSLGAPSLRHFPPRRRDCIIVLPHRPSLPSPPFPPSDQAILSRSPYCPPPPARSNAAPRPEPSIASRCVKSRPSRPTPHPIASCIRGPSLDPSTRIRIRRGGSLARLLCVSSVDIYIYICFSTPTMMNDKGENERIFFVLGCREPMNIAERERPRRRTFVPFSRRASRNASASSSGSQCIARRPDPTGPDPTRPDPTTHTPSLTHRAGRIPPRPFPKTR